MRLILSLNLTKLYFKLMIVLHLYIMFWILYFDHISSPHEICILLNIALTPNTNDLN